MAGIHLTQAAGAAEECIQIRFYIVRQAVCDGAHKFMGLDGLSQQILGHRLVHMEHWEHTDIALQDIQTALDVSWRSEGSQEAI